MSSAMETVLRFNEYIASRDLTGLVEMMTDDHVLIDTAGHRVEGKAACIEAWRSFFEAFPDYHNVFDRLVQRADDISVAGASHCSDPRLAGPALWSARTSSGRVREWRVWVDTAENRKQLGLN